MSCPTVIITGASEGIGRQLALIMAREGYDLGLLARRLPLLEALRAEIVQKFPSTRVEVAACDVAQLEACRQTIFQMAKQLGRLDIFVANAGIGYQTPAWKKNWEWVRPMLEVNVMGAIASLEAAKEIMLDQKSGHLVGISSVAAFRGLPTSAAYCTSKGALKIYLESLRADLKRFNIHVTSIHPGYVATPMTAKNRHYMPFLLSVEKGCEKIFKAIRQKKNRTVFPWQMRILVGILEWMPDFLYDYLMGKANREGVFR